MKPAAPVTKTRFEVVISLSRAIVSATLSTRPKQA